MLARLPTAAAFGALALLRRRHRALHPRGVAYSAELELGPGAPAPLGPPRTVDAVVRLSRAAGLPRPLPDVLGVAVKVPSMHGPGLDQDLLFSTTWQRHLLRPVRGFGRAEVSTILPFALPGGERAVLGLLPAGEGRWRLASAPVAGAWGTPWGELRLGRRLPEGVAEELRFHPFTTAPDLRPIGPFSELRKPAYRASQSLRR